MNKCAVILAGGEGKRMGSEKPKTLCEVLSKPMLRWVIDAVKDAGIDDICIVKGYRAEYIDEYVSTLEFPVETVLQAERLGTGHAVMMCEDGLKGYEGDVLIVYGDMPLFKAQTYKDIIAKHQESGAAITVLTADVENPPAYGRIIRDENGKIIDSVEDKDCTPEQKKITELNVGVYVVNSKKLFATLKKIGNNNAQGEYYLTDISKVLISEGEMVESHTIFDLSEIVGVNTVEDLAFCEDVLKNQR